MWVSSNEGPSQASDSGDNRRDIAERWPNRLEGWGHHCQETRGGSRVEASDLGDPCLSPSRPLLPLFQRQRIPESSFLHLLLAQAALIFLPLSKLKEIITEICIQQQQSNFQNQDSDSKDITKNHDRIPRPQIPGPQEQHILDRRACTSHLISSILILHSHKKHHFISLQYDEAKGTFCPSQDQCKNLINIKTSSLYNFKSKSIIL